MRRMDRLVVFLLAMQAATALAAADFTIEDKGLAMLPQEVEIAIRARSGSEFTACRLVGKPIDLTGKSTQPGYAATTAAACGWEGSLGPIWVILVTDGTPRLVLTDKGQSLTVGKQTGVRNLATSARAPEWYRENLWKFDGKTYKSIKSYHFTRNDQSACRAHPKICPFKFGDR